MLIYKDKESINNYIEVIDNICLLLNKIKPLLEIAKIKFSEETINYIRYNKSNKVHTFFYQQILKQKCMVFGQNYNEAKLFGHSAKYDWVNEMAYNIYSKYEDDIRNIEVIIKVNGEIELIVKCIEFNEEYKPVKEYKNIIENYFTYYTQNKQQEKLLKLISQYKDIKNKICDIVNNKNIGDIESYFSTGKSLVDNIYRLTK